MKCFAFVQIFYVCKKWAENWLLSDLKMELVRNAGLANLQEPRVSLGCKRKLLGDDKRGDWVALAASAYHTARLFELLSFTSQTEVVFVEEVQGLALILSKSNRFATK